MKSSHEGTKTRRDEEGAKCHFAGLERYQVQLCNEAKAGQIAGSRNLGRLVWAPCRRAGKNFVRQILVEKHPVRCGDTLLAEKTSRGEPRAALGCEGVEVEII